MMLACESPIAPSGSCLRRWRSSVTPPDLNVPCPPLRIEPVKASSCESIPSVDERAGTSSAVSVEDIRLCNEGVALCLTHNYDAAAVAFTMAATRGLSTAQTNLGMVLYHGLGCPHNSGAAAEWWRRAASAGHAVAACSLGLLYERGDGVPANAVEAHALYTLAAEAGDGEAQRHLAKLFERGAVGVKHNPEEALRWYERAASLGRDTLAQRSLAQLQNNDVFARAATLDYTLQSSPLDVNTQLEHGSVVVARFSAAGAPAEHWALFDKGSDSFLEFTTSRKPKGGCSTGSVSEEQKGMIAWLLGRRPYAAVQQTSRRAFFSTWAGHDVHLLTWSPDAMAARAAGAVMQARRRVGETPPYFVAPVPWDDAVLNCESFIRHCFDGVAISTQAERYFAPDGLKENFLRWIAGWR